jgi:hypothetical protein
MKKELAYLTVTYTWHKILQYSTEKPSFKGATISPHNGWTIYSAFQSRVAPEIVGLQKE